MPVGAELWLAVSDTEAAEAISRLTDREYTVRKLETRPDELEEWSEFNTKLDACYDEALAALGLTVLSNADPYRVVHTPLGQRRMSPWDIHLYYDPIEVGYPPVFGVSLTGRYFPTLLDWKCEHGTLYELDFLEVLSDAHKVLPILYRELPFTKAFKLRMIDIFY